MVPARRSIAPMTCGRSRASCPLAQHYRVVGWDGLPVVFEHTQVEGHDPSIGREGADDIYITLCDRLVHQ